MPDLSSYDEFGDLLCKPLKKYGYKPNYIYNDEIIQLDNLPKIKPPINHPELNLGKIANPSKQAKINKIKKTNFKNFIYIFIFKHPIFVPTNLKR